MTKQDVVARARVLVGVRFRPQGRRREHGLDCVGLVAIAGGLPIERLPADYRMRSRVPEAMLSSDLDGRVKPIAVDEATPGDVLLVEAGLGQQHFLLLTGDGYVHADAGLGRVVETPGPVPWPICAAWRFLEI